MGDERLECHGGRRSPVSLLAPQHCGNQTHQGAPAAAGTRRRAQRRAGRAFCEVDRKEGGQCTDDERLRPSLPPASSGTQPPHRCIRCLALSHRYSWSLRARNWQAPSPATRRSMRQKSARRSWEKGNARAAKEGEGARQPGSWCERQQPAFAIAPSKLQQGGQQKRSLADLQPRPPFAYRLARHAPNGLGQQLCETREGRLLGAPRCEEACSAAR